jgi:phosphoribosylformylglycinamidine synthase
MREDDMTAYELMLSESQERMLCVAENGREGEVLDVFRKWGLKAEVVGHVTDDGIVTVTRFGKIEAQVDPKLLTDHCPVYKSTIEEPEYYRQAASFDPSSLPSVDAKSALLTLLAAPDIASKRWVFEQYDQQVQTQTTLSFGRGDAAVLAPRGTKKGLALKIDGNARQTYLHPLRGGLLAVCEAARNVACTGAQPRAATDGLNFGNPTHPHVYWQFERAVRGIADAAEALQTPVISGNVSFYNQSDLGEVPPTPLIGVLGILEDANDRLASAPSAAASLYLLEIPGLAIEQGGLGASAYAAYVHGIEDGYPVAPDLAGESRLYSALVEAAASKAIVSAHDSSEGGLAVALAEIALQSGLRVSASLAGEGASAFFGEVPGRVVVAATDSAALTALASKYDLSVTELGSVEAGAGLSLTVAGETVELAAEELNTAFEGSIPAAMAE